MKKTIAFTNAFIAVFLLSVIIGVHAHAGGSGALNGPSYVYMNEKAASTKDCDYKGVEGGMHKYRCEGSAGGYFELKSHGVETAGGYKTCTFNGKNWTSGAGSTSHHEVHATEHTQYCTTDKGTSDNTFYAIVDLEKAPK